MKALCSGIAAAVLMASGCQAKEPPTQVVYRFDDHRYLELKGWDCEGELWYTDTQRGIHSEPVSQFYEYLLKSLSIPQNVTSLFQAGESVGFVSLRITAKPGRLHNSLPEKMNRME
jgi:hypothetical protein